MPAEYGIPEKTGQSKPLNQGRILWDAFRYEVERLKRAGSTFSDPKHYYRCQRAYRALRDGHVPPRPRGRPAFGKDPTLERWFQAYQDFLTRFWGVDEGEWIGRGDHKKWKPLRRFTGVKPSVAAVMREYQRLWGFWYRKSAHGVEQAKKARARYLKDPVGALVNLDAKRAYALSERGKSKRKKSRQRAAQVAKGTTQQALYDSWNTEAQPTLTEVLADV